MSQHNQSTPTQEKEFEEKMVQVSRVSKKTKGGNKMGFSVLMVVGDKKGRVGVGLGKAGDVSAAMKKGVKKAKKKMIVVPTKGTTIPFSVTVKHGAAVVLLKPAPQGSGVIAGGPVRAVVEAAGIRDISSKILGTGNQASNVYATFAALREIQSLMSKRPGQELHFAKKETKSNNSVANTVEKSTTVKKNIETKKHSVEKKASQNKKPSVKKTTKNSN